MSYTHKAVAGFSWQTIYKGGLMLLALVKIFVLARLLNPQAFGLFSLTLIALGITESMTQTGVNITILQSKRPIGYFLDSAWVISIIRGFGIGSLMLVMGLFMQRFYQEPQLLALIGVAALVPVIKGFINPYIVVMQKELRFFQDSVYLFSLSFVEGVTSIILGLALHSVWAMILGLVAGAIFEVIISFLLFRTRPRFAYLHSRGKSILENARWLSISTVFNYLNENADNFLLGKIVGTYSLGIYQNAYALSHKPNYEFSKSAHYSVLPVFAKIIDKPGRLERAFFRSLIALGAFITAVSLPLLIFPQQFVQIILGNQWLEAIPLIRPLVLAGITQSVSQLSYALFLARKDYRILNLHLISAFVLMVVLILWWGGQSQLQGAVMAVLVSRLVTVPLIVIGILRAVRKSA